MDALDRQARIAGWLYLLLVIPGPFVLIYLPSKLIVRGDAAATAANLLAHEKLFRFGMVADVAGSVFFLVLAFALYRLLSRVDRARAAFMVALVMVSSAIACVNVLPNAAALALARAGESLTVLDQTQREALAVLFLRLHSIGNTVNETFWGLWLVPFGLLVYRSGFLPRFLGAWLVVNGAAYVALSGIGLMRPELSGKAFLYAQPLLFGELAIMLWLIIKGAKLKQLAATA
jgi:Domain of unknown function (DUF4386)